MTDLTCHHCGNGQTVGVRKFDDTRPPLTSPEISQASEKVGANNLTGCTCPYQSHDWHNQKCPVTQAAQSQSTPAQGSGERAATPLTDKEVYVLYTNYDEYVECIQPDFARNLEQQLIEALKESYKLLKTMSLHAAILVANECEKALQLSPTISSSLVEDKEALDWLDTDYNFRDLWETNKGKGEIVNGYYTINLREAIRAARNALNEKPTETK
jgi:hypothetical protein